MDASRETMDAKLPRAEAFPKTLRLRLRAEFRQVQDRGSKVHTGHFILFTLRAGPAGQRLGITVTRKVGGAVVRNRLKRCARETFRRHRDRFPSGQSIVVLMKRSAAELDSRTVQAELLRAARRLRADG